MSVSRHHRDELERLNEEAARLNRYYEQQSEVVRIDFRRRYDQAMAVVARSNSIWEGIDQATGTLKAHKEDKGSVVVGGLLLVSTMVAWWLWPEYKKSFGVALIFTAYFAFWYGIVWRDASNVGKHLAKLRMYQDDLLCQWQATGAGADEFWRYRDWARRHDALDAMPESERDEAQEESDAHWYGLRHRIRQSLFQRASGTRQSYLPDESGDYVLESDPW